MNCKFFSLALLIAFSAFSGYAQAGVLGSIIGSPAELEDVDYESQVWDANNDGLLNDGDLLLAILEVDKANKLGGLDFADNNSVTSTLGAEYTTATSTFTAVSLIKVATATLTAVDEALYTFTGASADEWLTHTGIAGVTDGTGAILYDDPPSNPHINPSVSNDGNFLSEVATATNGTLIAEFSVVAWFAEVEAISGGNPFNVDDVDDLDFIAALNTDSHLFAPHNILGDPDMSGPLAGTFQGIGAVDLQLQGNVETGFSGNFSIRTDTNLYVHAVPEPTSFAIFGALGLAGLGVRRRRRA